MTSVQNLPQPGKRERLSRLAVVVGSQSASPAWRIPRRLDRGSEREVQPLSCLGGVLCPQSRTTPGFRATVGGATVADGE